VWNSSLRREAGKRHLMLVHLPFAADRVSFDRSLQAWAAAPVLVAAIRARVLHDCCRAYEAIGIEVVPR
jgi:hypothetical protein